VKLPPGEDINEWLAVNSKNHYSMSGEDIPIFPYIPIALCSIS